MSTFCSTGTTTSTIEYFLPYSIGKLFFITYVVFNFHHVLHKLSIDGAKLNKTIDKSIEITPYFNNTVCQRILVHYITKMDKTSWSDSSKTSKVVTKSRQELVILIDDFVDLFYK